MKCTKIVNTRPPFNKIDPDPTKNYGRSDLHIQFILKGDNGAVYFLMGTGSYLEKDSEYAKGYCQAWDLGYHSPTQRWEGQSQCDCNVLDGGKCYNDGSVLNAEPVLTAYLNGGDDAVWKYLEDYYYETFGRD